MPAHSPVSGPPFQKFTRACAWALVATGCLVFLGGWVLDITALKNIVPGTVFMKPSTAAALTSLGFSLLLLRDADGGARRHMAGKALALFPLLVGLAFLSEFVLGWDLHIDEFPFVDEVGRKQGVEHPGRLAPTTAVNLVLVGLALVLLDARPRRGWRLAEVLVMPVALVASMSLIGYTYAIPAFYGPGSAAKMALNTAACFVIFAAAVAMARPHGRLLALATTTAPGGMMARRLFPFVVVMPLLLGWARLEASDAGVFSDRVGTWWLTATTIAGLVLLVWRGAAQLNRANAGRLVLESKLYTLANHDHMTGLYNRHHFEEALAMHSAVVSRHGGPTTLLAIDLDNLKEVNDGLGHAAGDALITAVGEAITGRLRQTDVAGRLGGDEFALILHNSSPAGALKVAHDLRAAISAARPAGTDPDAWSTASIGVAYRTSTLSGAAQDLLAEADAAMYEAKRAGGDQVAYRWFDSNGCTLADPSPEPAAGNRNAAREEPAHELVTL